MIDDSGLVAVPDPSDEAYCQIQRELWAMDDVCLPVCSPVSEELLPGPLTIDMRTGKPLARVVQAYLVDVPRLSERLRKRIIERDGWIREYEYLDADHWIIMASWPEEVSE